MDHHLHRRRRHRLAVRDTVAERGRTVKVGRRGKRPGAVLVFRDRAVRRINRQVGNIKIRTVHIRRVRQEVRRAQRQRRPLVHRLNQ